MSGTDFRSELDMWIDMWSDAEEQQVHPKREPVKPSSYDDLDPSEKGQDIYYDYVGSEELLQEERTMNPVYPDSAGPDQDGPKPAWVSETLLKEVEKLKNRLFKVENQMAKMGSTGKVAEKATMGNDKKLMAEIKSIRQRIDRVSNQEGVKDEPSPWQIKRD